MIFLMSGATFVPGRPGLGIVEINGFDLGSPSVKMPGTTLRFGPKTLCGGPRGRIGGTRRGWLNQCSSLSL